MKSIVIDSSIALAWCFSDESSPLADAVMRSLRQQEAWVPALWPLEVANILAISERRGRVTLAETEQFLSILESLPIRVEPVDRNIVFDRVLTLARNHKITVYDASYLELAERLSSPLATLDKLLIQAAQKDGISLYQIS
jgi:predicted nucleic acid-binding protein